MYNQFFGFKERPFKLVPDPDYLFLSKSHEEALAYLKYAIAEEEGFVEIIGEVGTGKTMLCRVFLEKLGEDTESAYIFNPKMNALELLKAISDEFGLPSDFNDTKSLIDALNVFLMGKKSQGKKAILIIDEAQNLGKEVLEQIRLLSNLETTKNKLLQIILVGQPELGDLLDSYELRQLNQRISLSCRLKPLSFSETMEYILHRLHVASHNPASIFTRSAIRRIYKYSGGIPRLINIACDRSLLTAYGFNRKKVTGEIAEAAIAELISRGEKRNLAVRENIKKTVAAISIIVLFAAAWVYRSEFKLLFNKMTQPVNTSKLINKDNPGGYQPSTSNTEYSFASSPLSSTANAQAEAQSHQPDEAFNIASEQASLGQILLSNSMDMTRANALKTVLGQWGADPQIPDDLNKIKNNRNFFILAARQHGLNIEEISGDLGRIRGLNLCAILEFKSPDMQSSVYLTVVGADSHSMAFFNDTAYRRLAFNDDEIQKYWTGRAYVFWKNFYNYQGIIPINAQGDSIITLKLHLRDIGIADVEINATYDEPTREAIKTIQARHGIPVDGYVGPLTKIALYNEKPSLPIPRLLKLESSN
jgi:general secretion pathway protein A